MFVDKVEVLIAAGKGGDGAVSFRHEKFIARGGPDGGDGGKGGDVVVYASNNQNTLAKFRYQKQLQAEDGRPGFKRRKRGKSGQDLRVPVPVGTVITDENGQVLADLTEEGQAAVVAHGGKGGFGNAHFVSSTRQAPRVAEKGEEGEALKAVFEMKLIADVGLVGLPNAGKSTLLARISNARPEIANYPFTTLTPNLGMVDIDKKTTLLFADIPGLIAGASEGKGLGDEFLRHIERTSVLVHLIDAYQDDVASAYATIQQELKNYRVDLSSRPQLLALNKTDGLDADILDLQKQKLLAVVPDKTPVFAISAQSGHGVKELLYAVKTAVADYRKREAAAREESKELPVLRLKDEQAWQVKAPGDGVFVVSGQKIERFAARTDFSNPHGVQRLRDIMRKMGIMHELARQGIEPGDKVRIKDHTIEY